MGKTKKINLALQGGGAHGAFTWGVVDALLEEPDIEIAGISGTSAGALNGAALKAGLACGSREAARENLEWFWSQIGAMDDGHVASWMTTFGPPVHTVASAIEYSPVYMFADAASRMMSPYTYGPLYRNPLTDIASKFKFENVCSTEGPQLFVNATNVRTGRVKVFSGMEITAEALMASACLPTMFQAVEIYDDETGRDEAYWDGGYMGNPALFPLFDSSLPEDIVIVNINPLEREEIPTSSQAIQNRINEISFNSSLLREIRSITLVKSMLDDGSLTAKAMRDVHIHMISDDGLMNDLNVATKIMANPYLISKLKEAGRVAASEFLADHRSDLNKTSSVDLDAMFS